MSSLRILENHYPTESFLISILRSDWDQATQYIKEKSIDYNKLKTLVRRTGTGSYIFWLISKASKDNIIAEEFIQFLKKSKEKTKIDNSYILGILDKVIAVFSEEGIAVILLKGADLVHRIYESVDLRHLDDIDLLIHFKDLEKAIDALHNIGFRVPTQRELGYFKRASYNIDCWSKGLFPCLFELHWDLSQKFRYRIDMQQIWHSCQQQRLSDAGYVRFLKPEFLFIHLCVHLFHHSFHAQLKWHIDLKEILEKMKIDMNEVAERSREWGCQYSVYYALLYFKKIFPEYLNNGVFHKLSPPKLRDYFISKFYSDNPITLFDSQGHRYRERFVRTIAVDRKIDIFLFSLNRVIRNPWVHFEDD